MRSLSEDSDSATHSAFIDSLSSYSRLHRAQRWEGTFSEFLSTIVPTNPAAMARSSHQYIWDMLNWHGRAAQGEGADSKWVLTQGIANISTNAGYHAEWSTLFAALTLAILPMIVVYAIFQRQIQAGLTAGAVK